MAAENDRPPWPLHCVHKAISEAPTHRLLAAIVLSGGLNPVHIGHIQMIRSAKERLESAGFYVVGCWLSPAEEWSLKSKAELRFIPALSAEMRLRAAELAVQAVASDFLAVGAWQAGIVGRSVQPVEVVQDLSDCLRGNFKGVPIRVFAVCSTAYVKLYSQVDASKMQGVVMVPRDDQDIYLEDPRLQRFLTSGIDALHTSTRLTLALRCGDDVFVQKMMPGNASRLFLDPSRAERAEFSVDFDLLSKSSQTVPCCFPTKKFTRRFSAALERGNVESPAILVADGTMSLTHRGHVRMMWQAKERLERVGITVLGAWLVPWGEADAKNDGAPELSTAFRQRVAELSVCDDEFVSIGYIGSQQKGAKTPFEVVTALQGEITDRFVGSFRNAGLTFRVFYVCGMDVGEKTSTKRGLHVDECVGLVTVPRGSGGGTEDPVKRCFVADADPSVDGLSSTKLRADLSEGNIAVVTSAMAEAAARFVLAPTPAEKEAFAADFGLLNARAVSQDASTFRDRLKGCFAGAMGDAAVLRPEDVSRILNVLDPSWTSKELSSLQACLKGKTGAGGVISTEDFVDGLVGLCT
eukprot:TRINITY_DN10596_c0_g1_i1.p1 TRINITY_DN10596_c0_g1~~TRINITY_DN10596_c0_g1_i1.p1  ORF type:complete len:607 (-),score=103.68 TRINITY_DN10596_c0_g1_i1:41-1780(-)